MPASTEAMTASASGIGIPTSDAQAPPPVGLYLHVPFCVSLCPYCDFVVYTGRATRGPNARMEAFLRAVRVELRLRADALDMAFGAPVAPSENGGSRRPPLESVYIGGGTPSLLAATDVAALLELIERRFGLAAGAEVTIEANPGPDERGDLAGFHTAGVTRISVGAQSLDPVELKRLGRRHHPSDAHDTLHAAQRAGFEHRSLDLLYDVPGQTAASWRNTVAQALDTPIDHLSAYALTLDDPDALGLAGAAGDHLPVRAGARRWRQAAARAQDDDRAADQYLWLDERLTAAGLGWYEVSNWARPGGASHHNQAYWRRLPMLGVGPGAHGFDGGHRRAWNGARLDAYVAALSPQDGPPGLPPGGEETIDDDAARLERISLSLRTSDGLAADELSPEADADVAAACAAGLIDRSPAGRLVLTARGRLLAGELAARLAA